MYAAYVCETVTGNFLAPIDCNIKSWKRELLGNDAATIELAPGALTQANRDLIRLITTPWRSTLVIEWINPGDHVGVPVFAGPIVTRPWDQSLQITAVGIRNVLDRRKLINWTGPYATQSLQWSNMSFGSIGINIVKYVTGQSPYPAKAGASLPIIFPSVETDTDPTHVKTYSGFNLKTAGSALNDLAGLINGPEHEFAPVWSDGNRSQINWLMRVGTTEQPLLTTSTIVSLDATQPTSPVKKLTYLEDASQVATRQWGNGSGTDVDTLMATASNSTLVNAGWPALEQQKDYKSQTDATQLASEVGGDLALAQNPIIQWTAQVDGSQSPLLGTYPLAQQVAVNVRNHIWIPDSPPAGYMMRVVGFSGDSSTTVTLKMQGV